MTRVGQRVGSRVGQRVGQVVTATPGGHGPITQALEFDGVVKYGRIVYDAPPYTDGVTVLAEVAPDEAAHDRRIFTFTPTFGAGGGEILGLGNVVSPYRTLAAYDTRTDGPIVQTGFAAPAAADSAGYRISGAAGAPSGGQVRAWDMSVGPSGTVYRTASSAELDAETGAMRVIHIGRFFVASSYYKGHLARIAIFEGVLSEAQIVDLYPAEDWRDVRTPIGYWLPQQGVDDGANMVIPDLMGGPSATMSGTQRSDLSATVPTRVAA